MAAPPALRGGAWATALALGGWTAVVVAAWWVARPHALAWKIPAPPLIGAFDPHVTVGTFLVLGVGLVAARTLPGWCERVPWARLLVGVALVSLLWGAALACTRGASGLARGLASSHEYPAVVHDVDRIGVSSFVDTFTREEVLRTYPTHVQGHPLGAALLFVGFDRIGLRGGVGAAIGIGVVAASAMPAVLLTVREVAGADAARRAAPFLVLMPGVVWWMSSADALYAAVAAWAIALLVLATADGLPTARRTALAVGSGLAWGIGAHLTYGLPPLALVALTVVVARRRWSVLVPAALGLAVVFGAFTAGGFWWFDGLAATKVRYHAGVAAVRPYAYFSLLGNPAAFSLAIGPAAWVAALRVRERGLLLLAVPALAAVLVADASGLSKAEVERIWLPYAPWVLVLAGGLVDRWVPRGGPDAPRRSIVPGWPPPAGALLMGQVVLAVAIESFVKTPW